MCPDSALVPAEIAAAELSRWPSPRQSGRSRPCRGRGSSRPAPCRGTADGSPRRTNTGSTATCGYSATLPLSCVFSSHDFPTHPGTSHFDVPSVCPATNKAGRRCVRVPVLNLAPDAAVVVVADVEPLAHRQPRLYHHSRGHDLPLTFRLAKTSQEQVKAARAPAAKGQDPGQASFPGKMESAPWHEPVPARAARCHGAVSPSGQVAVNRESRKCVTSKCPRRDSGTTRATGKLEGRPVSDGGESQGRSVVSPSAKPEVPALTAVQDQSERPSEQLARRAAEIRAAGRARQQRMLIPDPTIEGIVAENARRIAELEQKVDSYGVALGAIERARGEIPQPPRHLHVVRDDETA
jgi:hypothetical protein